MRQVSSSFFVWRCGQSGRSLSDFIGGLRPSWESLLTGQGGPVFWFTVRTDNDYHKYFIVDGKHVGDYEGMYRNCLDPWMIEELGLRLDMRAALLLVDLLPVCPLNVLDAGSGAGLLSMELLNLLARTRPGSRLTLSDISLTALNLARSRISGRIDPDYPVKLTFTPFDLRLVTDRTCPWSDHSFDLIFMAQVLWGLVENIDGLFPGLSSKLSQGGHLIISQHFPGCGRQNYAPFLDPPKVLELASKAGLELLHTIETDRNANHHLAAIWSCN